MFQGSKGSGYRFQVCAERTEEIGRELYQCLVWNSNVFCKSAIAFLAAYPTEDLSKIDIEALSIVGSNDSILDRAEYDEATNKMPAHMRELIIPGGNHANFGNYGAQQNDGEATITREEQQILTARAIAGLAEAA